MAAWHADWRFAEGGRGGTTPAAGQRSELMREIGFAGGASSTERSVLSESAPAAAGDARATNVASARPRAARA